MRLQVKPGDQTRVMGVVNVTPDSFYDGGRYRRASIAVRHALQLAADGAHIIDIGGESTRPGSQGITLDEELDRVIPVIEGIRDRSDIPVSIDTWKAEVARRALAAGADWINDVSGGVRDPDMLPLVAETGVPYVAMHMRGTPQTMRQHIHYENLVGEIAEYFERRTAALAAAGGRREQVILDPGIGFAKHPADNYTLLARLDELRRPGRPLLVGPSRKSFLKLVGVDDPDERLPGTLAAVAICAFAGVEIVRVHDVKEAVQAVRVARRVRQHATLTGSVDR